MSSAMLPTGPKIKPSTAGSVTVPNSAQAHSFSSILAELPVFHAIAEKIGITELRRRLTHMTPIFLPFLLWVIPHQDPWGPLLINTVLVIALTIVGLLMYRFQAIARSQEEHGLAAVVGYAVPIVVTVLLMPDRAELGMMTLAILAIGDGSATLGGLCLGGRRLPWNNRKTFSGLLSFCFCGTVMASLVYWGEARPGVTWQAALACGAISTFAAAFVESLPLPWNDNLRVGSTAALVGTFVQIVWLGR